MSLRLFFIRPFSILLFAGALTSLTAGAGPCVTAPGSLYGQPAAPELQSLRNQARLSGQAGGYPYTRPDTSGKQAGNAECSVSLAENASSTWLRATRTTPWSYETVEFTLVFKNRLWAFATERGGEAQGGVWSSSDGINWIKAATPPWYSNYSLSLRCNPVIFNNKIYVVHGTPSNTGTAEVWSSSDGNTWTRLATAPWDPRYDMRVLVFNNQLWMLGGIRLSHPIKYYNDVWSSSDGMTWKKVTDAAPWAGRAHHQLEVFGGKMWIMGGIGPNGRFNDVWSSPDGKTWAQATASAAWTGRSDFASVVADGKLWILGGETQSGCVNEVWSSPNGVTWTRSAVTVPWCARSYLSALMFQNCIYMLGGQYGNTYYYDVWYLPIGIPAMSVTPDTTFSAAGTRGGAFTPATFTYTLANLSNNTQALAWRASKTQSWVTLSKTSGTLAARARDTVTVSINAGAKALALGSHLDQVLFTNATTGQGITVRPINLNVNPLPAAWQLATSAAPWAARKGHATTVLNGKLYLIGGDGKSDIWSTSDGANWTLVTAAIPGGARTGRAAAVLNGKIYLMGGYDTNGTLYHDVWSSSDGVHWTSLTGAAAWSPRYDMRVLAFNNKLWLFGGCEGLDHYDNDIWSSGDGRTWTKVTGTAPWTLRRAFGAEVFGGRMWIMGGRRCSFIDTDINDVWSSSDGVNWTCVTHEAAWLNREDFALVATDGNLWIIGGLSYGNFIEYLDDVWYSPDGANWTKSTLTLPWNARIGLNATAFLNRIYMLGGAYYTASYQDVWYLPNGMPSMTVTPDAGLAASGVPGGPFAPASATYTLTNTTAKPLAWRAGKTQNWTTLSKTSGTLAAGARDTVIASMNAGAKTLALGSHADTVTFTNATTGQGNTARPVNLTVSNGWQLAPSAAPWPRRWGMATAVFNNKLWLLGGTNGINSFPEDAIDYNDVWSSSDGINWTRATAKAPWPARSFQGVAVLNGKLYLMGGYGNRTDYNDVWSSSDGVNWSRLTAAAPWGARWGLRVLAFNNRLWVLSGSNSDGWHFDDAWSSSDGITWTNNAPITPWAGRAHFGAEVFGGRMWVMGGHNGSSYLHDAWSSIDGATWTQATAGAAWSGRADFASVAAEGKLWILGGYDGNSFFNEVWSSSDGANWARSTATVPWAARSGLGAALFQNRISIMGGLFSGVFQDAWYLPITHSTTGGAWIRYE